jgi:prepilin-type N-terminal cleavage/methylation domain-containing protein
MTYARAGLDRAERPVRRCRDERGFSLIEVSIAMLVLMTGLLGLASVMGLAMRHVGGSSATLIAREKAREAVESVHTARDTGTLSWDDVRNAPDGVFIDGETPLYGAGADGLVNTADDADAGLEKLTLPGADGLLATDDDEIVPLTEFRRQIVIDDLVREGTATVNPSLRQITVTIRYRVQGFWRTYTLQTYVSSYS